MVVLSSMWIEAQAFIQNVLETKLVVTTGAAARATGTALILWGEVALIAGGPVLRRWWRWQRGLSPRGLLIELGVFLAIAVLYALRAWLKRKQFVARLRRWVEGLRRRANAKWDAFVRSVEKKSRTLALAMPHLAYLALAFLVLRLFPSAATLLTADAAAEKLVVLVRAVLTIVAIHDAEASLVVDEYFKVRDEAIAAAASPSAGAATAEHHGGGSAGTPTQQQSSSVVSSLRRRFLGSPKAEATAEAAADVVATPVSGGPSSSSGRHSTPLSATQTSMSSLTLFHTMTSGAQLVVLSPGMFSTSSLASTSVLSSTAVRAGALAAAPPTQRQQHREACQHRLEANVVHWICLALFMATQRFASHLPLVGRLSGLVGGFDQRVRVLEALVMLWLQLPIGAVQLAYDHAVPALERKLNLPGLFSPPEKTAAGVSAGGGGGGRVGRGEGGRGAGAVNPAIGNLEARTAQLGGVLKMLVYSGAVKRETVDAAKEFCAGGWVLFGLVFLATPGFLTAIGCLLVGLAYPAACSAALLGRPDAFAAQVKWLKYWVVYAALVHGGHELVRTGLWRLLVGAHHAHLVLLVWMQLPYFRGAVKLHDAAKRKLLQSLVAAANGSGGGDDGEQSQEGQENKEKRHKTEDSVDDDAGSKTPLATPLNTPTTSSAASPASSTNTNTTPSQGPFAVKPSSELSSILAAEVNGAKHAGQVLTPLSSSTSPQVSPTRVRPEIQRLAAGEDGERGGGSTNRPRSLVSSPPSAAAAIAAEGRGSEEEEEEEEEEDDDGHEGQEQDGENPGKD